MLVAARAVMNLKVEGLCKIMLLAVDINGRFPQVSNQDNQYKSEQNITVH
jgi:hypothetical protein